jgi:predicted ATPase/DNA-binding winged helix-turn-helix (wHTH) protein
MGRDFREFAAFGPFRLFPAARRLEQNGESVELGGRALDLLTRLVEEPGKVISKSDLLSSVWGDVAVVEGVLRTHVCSLRKALSDGSSGTRYITSVAGRGYCFVAPVVRGATEANTDTLAAPASVGQLLTSSLPPQLARMAGRAETVRTLAAQLLEHRFVTIVGAAGIGKTTVAVSIGHALIEEFHGEVRFIDLASVTDSCLVAATVASTLGIVRQTDDALSSLQELLRNRRVLVVLDNCEHVVEAVAQLSEHLFLRAPRVCLLATSREALRVEGERAYRLGPLQTAEEHDGLSATALLAFPAVQVFLERAAASGWLGDLTDDEAPLVAQICKRLDGVALALELAASFVGECGLRGTAAMLDDRGRLLWQHGRRTAPPRQRTIHALIAWSYDRLPERERVVLRRLSVFVGTFLFDGATAIVLDEDDSKESLQEVMNELVGKSLLSVGVEDGAVVYRLLETTRVYALERLAESGELERMGLRHALLFTERLRGANDLGNVRAALKWSFTSSAGPATGVRLAAAAASMFLRLGLVSECQNWCRQALDVIGTDADPLVELGLQEAFAISAMFSRGNGDDVRYALTRGSQLARALGDGDREVRLLGYLNSLLIRRGDFKEALEVVERSIVPARATKVADQVRAKWMLAFSHHLCGNQALADEHCRSALRIDDVSSELLAAASRREDGFFSPHLGILARTLWLRGHADRALAAARGVLDGVAALAQPFERSSALITCEAIFVWCGEWADAERLLDRLAELVERHALGSQRGAAMALRGELFVKTGRPQEGCALLRAAASMQKAERNASFTTVYAGALAEGLAATGSLEAALDIVHEAIVEAERRGGTFDLPELLRIKGALLASRSPADDEAVHEALSASIELARVQGALSWELRAATELARGRLSRGGGADDVSELSAVYAKFTEGLQTPDVLAARDLLERQTRGGRPSPRPQPGVRP